MPEIRKLLRLAPNAYAVTIPSKYRKTLGLVFGDYVLFSLQNSKTISIQRHKAPEKI